MALIENDTFAFQTVGPAVAGESAAAAQASMDTIGSGVQDRTRAPDVPEQGDQGVLFKLAGKLLEPLVKQEQEAQFFEGMARAAAGEAAKDIAEGRSAISMLYGPSNVELGARAYEAESDATALMGKIYEALPTLSTMPTQQASQEIRKLVDASRPTGDPLRAQMYDAATVKEVPGILRTQARAYAEHMQARANQAHALRTVGLLDNFEAKFRTATNDDERTLAVNSVLEAFDVAPGQDPIRAMKNVAEALTSQVTQGKFAAFNYVRDNGLLAALPADAAAALQNRADVEARARAPGARTNEETLELAALLTDDTIPDDTLLERLAAFNARVRERTGIPADTWPMANNLSILGQRANEREAEAARAAAQNAKSTAAWQKARDEAEAEDAENRAILVEVDRALNGGYRGIEPSFEETRLATTAKARTKFDAAVGLAWRNASVENKAAMIQNAGYFVRKHVDAWTAQYLTPGAELTRDKAGSLGIEAVAAVAAKFPNDYASRLGLNARQDAMLTSFMSVYRPEAKNADAAWEFASAKARAVDYQSSVSAEDREAAAAELMSRVKPWFDSPTQLDFMSARVAQEMKNLSPSIPAKDRARTAYERAARSMEVHGKVVVLKRDANQVPAWQLLSAYSQKNNMGAVVTTDGTVARGLQQIFKAKANPGDNMEDWLVVRGPDSGGLPVYHAYSPDLRTLTITGSEILKLTKGVLPAPGPTATPQYTPNPVEGLLAP